MPAVYAIISFFSYRFFRYYTYYSLISIGASPPSLPSLVLVLTPLQRTRCELSLPRPSPADQCFRPSPSVLLCMYPIPVPAKNNFVKLPRTGFSSSNMSRLLHRATTQIMLLRVRTSANYLCLYVVSSAPAISHVSSRAVLLLALPPHKSLSRLLLHLHLT